ADGVGSGNSEKPVFSPDGSKIAFISYASGFGATDTNDQPDVYLADLGTGKVSLVSVNQAGTDAGARGATGPVFDPTGTKILFTSGSDDLVAGDSNGATDVFVRDLVAGTTTLVSATPAGTAGNLSSSSPLVGPDGPQVAFASAASNLVPGVVDDNGGYDVFVRDLGTGTTSLESAGPDGQALGADSVVGFTPDSRALLLVSIRDLAGT